MVVAFFQVGMPMEYMPFVSAKLRPVLDGVVCNQKLLLCRN